METCVSYVVKPVSEICFPLRAGAAGLLMLARTLTLLLAACALAGAVIYAQQKADKKENNRPIFESSKSGTPTPIEEAPPAKKPAKKDEVNSAEVKQPSAEQTKEQEKPKKKKKKVMPTSKSYMPD